jgi:hypothetical protein
MLHELSNWWQFNFWLGLASLAAGIVVISPCLLSKRFRKWFSRGDFDLEGIGLVALVLAVLAIGMYNYFAA